MHSLLKRQVKRHFGDESSIPKELRAFLEVVDSAYAAFDSDRSMLERSLDPSSKELLGANAEIGARAEEALSLTREQLVEAQALAGLGSWEWNITDNTIAFSDQVFNLFGQPEDTAVTEAPFLNAFQSFLASIHSDDRDTVVQNLWRAIQSGGATDQEYRLVRPDGELRWVHEVGRAFLDETGKPVRMASTVQDITERKRVAATLAESLRDRENIMQTIPDIIYTLDMTANLVKWNKRMEEITGFSAEELQNRSALAFFPETEQPLIAEKIAEAFSTGYVEVDTNFLRKDGTTVPYQWTGVPLKDVDGNVIGLTGSGRDLTERKQAEESLRERERRLSQAQALAHLGYWHWDIPTNKVAWSEELYDIFGLEVDEFKATFEGYLERIHPNDRATVRATVENALGDRQPFTFEERIVRPDGEIRHVYSDGKVVVDDEGRLVSMMGICQDITVRKQAEEALRRETLFVKLLQIVAVNANLADSVDETLQITLDVIRRYTGWPVGHVYKPASDDPDVLEPTDIWSSETSLDFLAFRQMTEQTRLTRGSGLPGRVAASGEPAWIVDLTHDSNFSRGEIAQDIGVKAGFAFPIMAGKELAAVMEFFSTDLTEPDQQLLDVMGHIGSQLGAVVERKRAEEALQESEERTRLIVERAYDAFVAIDEAGVITDWNPQAEVTFGWPREEALGRPLAETIIPERFREAHSRGMRHFLATGEGPVLNQRLELSALHRDGHEFPVELTISSVKIGGSHVFNAFVHDISERKRAAEALEKHADELERFNRLAVGRELRMIELKREINDFARKLGGGAPYDISFAENGVSSARLQEEEV